MKDPRPRSNAQRSESTRAALLDAARRLFVEKGFAGTSTPEIVEAADVTRGALYHHFADKADVFRAVSMEMAHEVAHAVSGSGAGADSAFGELRLGARIYFAAMAEGGRARLLLLEAPAALSPEHVLELSEASGASQLREGLTAALKMRRLAKPAVQALADLLSAAFDRAALSIANGETSTPYLTAMEIIFQSLEAWSARPASRAEKRVRPLSAAPRRRRSAPTPA